MRIESLGCTLEWDGQYISISKRLAGRFKATTRRLHVSEITSVTLAEATWAMHGFIQFTAAGTPAAGIRKGGLSAGRPPREDMDSMSFSKKHNGEMVKLRDIVEAARRSAYAPPQQPAQWPIEQPASQHAAPWPPLQAPQPMDAWGAQQPVPQQPIDLAGQLAQLASLHQSGALTAAEYEAAKARLLSR